MRPPAIPLDDALVLVLAAQALLIMLAGLIVVRKLRRDRREQASARRRAEFAAAIGDGSPQDLHRVGLACQRHPAALVDLIYVLKNGVPPGAERRAKLLDAFERSGLTRKLRRDLGSRRAVTRGVAILTLSAFRLPGGEAAVARLAGDPDADVRLAVYAALAQWATPAAATVLIKALDRFDLPPERIVEKLGAAWAAPVVHSTLQRTLGAHGAQLVDPECLRNRVQLIRALELSAYQPAEPELLQLLATGGLEEQIGAARALASAGSGRAIPALLAALDSDSWPLRAQAARALGRLVAIEALPQLAAHLSDPAWWVRKQAGRALVAMGAAGGYELLQQALDHEDRYARDRAVEELRLASLGGPAAAAIGLTRQIPTPRRRTEGQIA